MSPAAPAVAIPTRSEIEAWSTAHLADAATAWRSAATASEDAFDQHRQNVMNPGGTTWEGDAKDAALDRVTRDIAVVGSQNDVLLGAADAAENSVTDINAAKREVLAAISAAEADDFTVGEDLSVTDNRAYDEETAAARAIAAAEHAEDVRWTAERLAQADSLAGSQLQAKAAELGGIRFDGETDGRDPTIQMVDNKTETTKADGEQPAKSWEDMLLPPESGEKPAAEGAPEPDAAVAEDAEKNPLDEMLLPDKTTDPDQPGNLNEALNEIAGEPVPDKPTLTEELLHPPPGTGKPGDPRYTKSPLESPIVNADPSVIDEQLARVEAARANVEAAEAAGDAVASDAYTQGAGAGPGAREAVPLGENLFDARRELTEQTAILEGLNDAAAEAGLPTVEIPELPVDADKQSFTPEPSAFAEGSRALSEGSFGLIPDVAKDIETFRNWDEASTADRIQAVTDAAGVVPLPGAKLFGEGIEHGLDALGVAGRHTDDLPTTHLDDITGPGTHHVPDAPNLPHADVPMNSQGLPGDRFDPNIGSGYASGDPHFPGRWPPDTPGETWVQGQTESGWKHFNRGDSDWVDYQLEAGGLERAPDGRVPEYMQVDPNTGRAVAFDSHLYRDGQEVFIDGKMGREGMFWQPDSDYWTKRAAGDLATAERQLAALPPGATLEWHVSNPQGAAALRAMLEKNDIFDIAVIYTPRP
ncbi:WXG100 family type VII secretion target [Mycolicibacterium iranicum]|uniref:Tox-REase-5 domain-containing protein n=1 Tax=Mycolicibacterium iranicum TaxID=912594 RepID=A0ABT4HLP2_MYCIR|nr:hypothetical protein [Mycolicibacterium iranicum]MCZ0730908.1 hypothetical protein [Mycolicibacterium iranicum]